MFAQMLKMFLMLENNNEIYDEVPDLNFRVDYKFIVQKLLNFGCGTCGCGT